MCEKTMTYRHLLKPAWLLEEVDNEVWKICVHYFQWFEDNENNKTCCLVIMPGVNVRADFNKYSLFSNKNKTNTLHY